MITPDPDLHPDVMDFAEITADALTNALQELDAPRLDEFISEMEEQLKDLKTQAAA